MKCTVNILIGEESIPIIIDMDSSLIPSKVDEDFMNLFKNSNNIDLIKDRLSSILLGGSKAQFEGEDKSNFGKYQIATHTAKDIMLSVPANIQAIFPDTDLSKIKVRLVDKFESYGTNIIVKQSTTGEDIYLLENNPKILKKFAEHLATEDAINHNVLDKLDENSEEIKIIDKILKQVKYKDVTDRKSLLKHYIKHKSQYSKININTEKGIYTASNLLDKIIPEIRGIYYPKNNNYSTPLISNLFAPGGMIYEKGLPTITYNKLYNILNGQYNLPFKSQKDFNDQMKSAEKTDEIIQFFNQFNIDVSESTEENYSILFKEIFKSERGFPFFYKRVNKDGKILFDSTYYEQESTYGATWDTIVMMDQDFYRGWRINKNEQGEYFISQYEMQPSTKGRSYLSRKEAKAAIDDKISKQTFRSSFMLPLFKNLGKINNTVTLEIPVEFNTLEKGNVISIPNIELPNKIEIINPREAIIDRNYTIDDFYDIVKSWSQEVQNILIDENGNLIKDINNVTKAGIFLVLLNSKYQNNERTPEMVNDVLEQMKQKTKYFYVESVRKVPLFDQKTKTVKKDSKGNIIFRAKEIKLIKLDNNPEDNEIEYKQEKGFQYPVISFWEESAEILNNVFGTNINIKTQSEIEDEFGSRYSMSKAFIIGDQVYINSTLGSTEDLFHEYIHIIMGYLKVNNREAYTQLLKQIWNNTSDYEKRKILDKDTYGDYSYEMKLEENFVKRFAEYIYNKGQINKIFNSTNIIENAFETIFDNAEFDLKEAAKHGVSEIFGRFSSEIKMALQKNDKLFNGFASSEEFKLSNQKTNLLHKWIKEGKLKEYGCK